jgi:colanic acid/amylovoran biosynthesis glycosyltransferase
MAKKLKDLGCPGEKVRIHPIGIELDDLTFKKRRVPSKGESIRILFCGRFVEKKGLKYALAAVQTTVQKFPDVEFRVIGDGDNRKEMRELVQKMELSRVVKFLGYRPYSEVVREMEQAHILLQPSITADDGDSEGGAPVILLEAQALGLPIVSTQHADIPNIVADGESGLLVPERDQAALSNALSYLLSHPKKWREMGRAGRKFVEQNHNIADLTDKLEKYYTQLIYG